MTALGSPEGRPASTSAPPPPRGDYADRPRRRPAVRPTRTGAGHPHGRFAPAPRAVTMSH